MSKPKLITLLIVGSVALLHIIMNAGKTTVWIFFFTPAIPLILMLAATFILGAIVGILLFGHKQPKLQRVVEAGKDTVRPVDGKP
jgi:uncharacterized integral membrane protein